MDWIGCRIINKYYKTADSLITVTTNPDLFKLRNLKPEFKSERGVSGLDMIHIGLEFRQRGIQ